MYKYRHKVTGTIISTPAELQSDIWSPVEEEKKAAPKPVKKTTRKRVQKNVDGIHDGK